VVDHVGVGDQTVQDGLTARVLEVERDAALAAVAPEHRARHGCSPLGDVVHLDDVGAEIGERLRPVRARHRQPEVEDRHALESVRQAPAGAATEA
jgi:hypothetical protein